MTPQQHILCTLQGHQDAVWTPCREPNLPRWVGSYLAREAFPKGLPLVAPSGLPRRDFDDLLGNLEAQGLLRFTKRQQGARRRGLLTARGSHVVQGLCGLPTIWETYDALSAMLPLLEGRPARWIPEPWLLDPPREKWDVEGQQLARIENKLLPALTRRWIDSSADPDGRVYYRAANDEITAALLFDTEDSREGGWLPDPPEVDPDCKTLYLAAHAQQSAALDILPANCREIGPPPMRTGSRPEMEAAS